MGLTNEDKRKCLNVAGMLHSKSSILFITGAGISVDSGLPTYRGEGGLYNGNVTEEGLPLEMVLAGEMIEERPAVTWKYLAQIEEKCRGARHNIAHEIIAEMEKYSSRVVVFTQNIDGFHQAAGSSNVIDIHGDMHKLLCPQCRWEKKVEDYSQIQIPPICPVCREIVRPAVVFFGEILPSHKVEILAAELKKGFDIYFSIGTSSLFPYISQPIIEAKKLNKPTIEINPDKTAISELIDIKISSPAGEALDEIWKEYQQGR